MGTQITRERKTYTGKDEWAKSLDDKTVTVLGNVQDRRGYVSVRDVYGFKHEVKNGDLKSTGSETNGASLTFEDE